MDGMSKLCMDTVDVPQFNWTLKKLCEKFGRVNLVGMMSELMGRSAFMHLRSIEAVCGPEEQEVLPTGHTFTWLVKCKSQANKKVLGVDRT